MNQEQFTMWLNDYAKPQQSLIMGILNVTPDSFYDGNCFLSSNAAYERAQTIIEQGVDIIDIGGESTKPGAVSVTLQEELDRVIPIIQRIRSTSDICISIDTSKPQVMRAAIAAGAHWINDVTALRAEDALATVAELQVPVCLMHMQGTPRTMQHNPIYKDGVVNEVNTFFAERIEACVAAGIQRAQLILDPGFGFGKTVQDNIELVRNFQALQQHQRPLLLGVSRKSTIGVILSQTQENRLAGGLALAAYAVMQGASIIRTHDIRETKQALTMLDVLRGIKKL